MGQTIEGRTHDTSSTCMGTEGSASSSQDHSRSSCSCLGSFIPCFAATAGSMALKASKLGAVSGSEDLSLISPSYFMPCLIIHLLNFTSKRAPPRANKAPKFPVSGGRASLSLSAKRLENSEFESVIPSRGTGESCRRRRKQVSASRPVYPAHRWKMSAALDATLQRLFPFHIAVDGAGIVQRVRH
jgi:hypothetical protein